MQIRKTSYFVIFISFLLALFLVNNSSAIPAFARQYKMSCTTCHAPIPRLKPYGEEFARNGFIMKENIKKRDFVTAGDDLLFLNRTFPIAVRFDAYSTYDEAKRVETDLRFPWGLKLLSGGPIYKNIGYYFYFYLSERGEVAGIEDAYIHFDNVFNSNLDIMVGQFQTSDPMLKRELRLTLEDYQMYVARIGYSRVNLTYDRGVMVAYDVDATKTGITALVVNGSGKGPASEEKEFDNDKYKNYAIRIDQPLGGIFRIGGYYYWGKEKEMESQLTNTITYLGPDFGIDYGPISFTGQYLRRVDTNPLFKPGAKEVTTDGYIGELIYSPKLDRSRWFLIGLYNKIDSELYKYETITASWTYLLTRNLRLVLEYTRDLEGDQNRAALGIVTGF